MIACIEPSFGASVYSLANYEAYQSTGNSGVINSEHNGGRATGWSSSIDELLRIRNLESDWDGEGSEAPHPTIVDAAISLAMWLRSRGVEPPGRVLASVNATVYFEWYSPVDYTEIEVISPDRTESRTVRRGSDTTEVVVVTRGG